MTSSLRRRVRAVSAPLLRFATVASLTAGSLLVVGSTPASAEPGGYSDCTQLPDNLFANCGFNQSVGGWAFDLPSTSIGISSAHSGSSSLAFQAYPDAPAGHSMSQSVTAPVAGTYRLGLWIYPVFAGPSDILAAVDDAAVVPIVPGNAPLKSWTYYSLDLALPAGPSTVHLDIPSGGRPRFDLLDDFSLRALIPAFAVSYDANGGAGSMSAGGYQEGGAAYVLADNGFSRSQYTFDGWNTAADGSGTSYTPGTPVTPSSALRLYAQWTPNSYTISYDGNSPTDAGDLPSNALATGGTPYIVGGSAGLSRNGYRFTAWNTEADGTGDSYQPGASISPTRSMTLYAQWTANTYAISYDANGGTGTTGGCSYTVGDGPCLVAENEFLRSGHTFAGWNTQADGSGVAYASGAGIYPSAALTLYAQWTANTYAISYDANAPQDEIGGELPAPGSYTTAGAGYRVAAPDEDLFRDGYVFTLWNTKADGTGTSYLPGDILTTTQDVTLYAQWRTFTGVGLFLTSSTQAYRTTDPQTLIAFAGVGTGDVGAGIIRFKHEGRLIGTVRLNEDGEAAMRVPTNLPLGRTSFTAEFTPTSRELRPAVSGPADLTIARVGTTTRVTVRQQSLTAAEQKQYKVRSSLSVSVQVVGNGTRTAAAGTVAITVNGKVTVLMLVGGRAKIALTPTAAGAKKVVATYRPSTDFWVRSTGRAEITVR